jgi:hypothetical protein
MSSAVRLTMTIVVVLLLSFVIAPVALMAQTKMPAGTALDTNTACGALATGRDANWTIVRMQIPGNRVDANGRWIACDRACGGSQRFVEWAVDGRRCTSTERLETSPTSRQRQQGALHGESETIRQRSGSMRGAVTYRCDDGTYSQVAATCEPAPVVRGCDEPIDVRAGRCRFQHSRPGMDGDQIAIRPSKGQGDMRAQCFGGVWLATSIYCAQR